MVVKTTVKQEIPEFAEINLPKLQRQAFHLRVFGNCSRRSCLYGRNTRDFPA
jgi:hypothetical protein